MPESQQQQKETVLIAGGSGLVGRELCKLLKDAGYHVNILSRQKSIDSPYTVYTWDIAKKEIEKEAFTNVDYIVQLAGASVAEKKWTAKRKEEILSSRVDPTELLLAKVKEYNVPLKAFISASAVGYYGMGTSDKIYTENDAPASDFLGNTCKQWEQAIDGFKSINVRTVKIRIGIVLSNQGGALAKMVIPIKLGVGSGIGTGKQYIPWIHIDDLCNIFLKAIKDDKMAGAYNAVASEYITNQAFNKQMAQVLHRPFWFPNIPSFVFKLLFGEMSTILLNGSRISNQKILNTGFAFSYSKAKGAFQNLLKK